MHHLLTRLTNTRLVPALLALAVLGGAGRAAATSCAPPPWEQSYASPLVNDSVAVPVDAHPWQFHSCYDGSFSAPSDCQLVGTDDTVAVEVELAGTEGCELDYIDLLDATSQQYIRRLVPAAPLTPGERYRLECPDESSYGEVVVRDDTAPSAPPPAIAVADAHYSRDNNGCCGSGDSLELRIDGLDDPAFDEGGIIEVTYPNGQIFAFAGLGDSDIIEVPPTEGTILLTPVAADGSRGETVELDAGEVTGDLVYIPCTVAARTPPAPLWLMAPFAWIIAHGRRRRGRAS